ncbi:uncharacterized protein N7483_011784 [Penicillium malachiteum]|uniref:uncharacterized protein n=1 Tax=Penicillium malachiteum TaxID=1324776 RepID=UPI002548B2AF|nr:uncharacterized protein N7483_011784 [Penicillium malachiteum]KAJ5714603.1 hypothetical protein N7483_011784 [Penicillium malachiteum]
MACFSAAMVGPGGPARDDERKIQWDPLHSLARVFAVIESTVLQGPSAGEISLPDELIRCPNLGTLKFSKI